MFDENIENEEQQINWREYFSIIYRGRWLIFILFLLIFGFAIFYTLRMSPVFQAYATLEISSDANMYSAKMDVFGNSSSDRNIANHIQLIKSRALSKMIVKALDESKNAKYISYSKSNLKNTGKNYNSRVEAVRNSIQISPIKDTDIVKIIINSNTGYEAAFLANTVAKQYEIYSRFANQGEISAVTDFLKEQLEKIKIKLKESEILLQNYKEKEGMVSLSEETKVMINTVAKLEADYNTSITSLNAIDEQVKYLKAEMSEKQKSLVDYISKNKAPVIESYKSKISLLHSKIADLEISNKPGRENLITRYQKMIAKYEEEIKGLANVMASSADAGIDPLTFKTELITKIMDATAKKTSLQAKAEAIKKIVAKYNLKMDEIPQKALELARLERKYKINEETYIMMQNKYDEYRISQAGQIGNARIVDEAIPPAKPIKPNKPLYIFIGAIVGLIIGVIAAFILAFFDNSIKTIEDLEKLKLAFLGAIPNINTEEIRKKLLKSQGNLSKLEVKKIESMLVTHFSPKSPISEAYKSIRTNIQFSNIDVPPRVFIVSSSVPKEGKSTTIANLAVAIAQTGNSVLLVDADMRRPVVHKTFTLLREIGLSDYLMRDRPIEEIVKKTDIENLNIITCGVIPHNPSELVGSKKMDKFIAEAKSMFDYVLFDTPPIITVTDAAVLSKKVDGVVIVVSSGKVGKQEVLRSSQLMKSVNSNIIGFVLNNMDIKKLYGNYYYYYHYYHYYYYYGAEKKSRKKRTKHKKRHLINEA